MFVLQLSRTVSPYPVPRICLSPVRRGMFTGYVQSCESSLIGETSTTQPHPSFSGINRSRREVPMLLENASSPLSPTVNSVVLQLTAWAYAVAESAIHQAMR